MNLISDQTAQLLENLNGFFYIKTSENITYSESVYFFTGFTTDEINRMGGLLSLVHEEDRFNVEDFFAEIEEDPSIICEQIEYRLMRKDESILWVKDDIRIIRNENDDSFYSTSIVTDITRLKNNEQKLLNSYESIKEVNSAKDKFISIISHDLRAPFTSLIGFSEILLNENELAPNDRNEYISYIYEASNTQLNLVNYLLDWSRLQSGKIQLEMQNINLKQIVASSVASLTGAAIRKNIEIEVDIDKDMDVNCDLRLINQVFCNLISNAIKFSEQNKKISITAQQFREGLTEIIVKDEGLGISSENQIKLFKIDQKVSTEGTMGEKGTGLGLMLVKEIIEKHGGNIWFYSEQNKGTEFHITLPEAQNIVLLVEDDEPTKVLFRHIISKALGNFEIIEANNGFEAMSFILKKMPSLLITDHDMPLMSGLHLTEAIRKKDRQFEIPIIVISAKLNDELIKSYKNLGVASLIEKPAESEIIISEIKKVVGN